MTGYAKIKTATKKKLLQNLGIKSLAVLSDEDLAKINSLSPEQQQELYQQDLLQSLKEPAHKVTKEEIRARVLKRLAEDG